jgi:hypothetical protein
MLVVNISAPILENDEEHKRTIVQVDDDPSFDDPLIDDDSEEDLFRRQYSDSLTPNTKYYVRARYYLEPGGYQGWSNVYTVTATDVNEVDIKMEPPIMAITPVVSIPYYDRFNTPNRDFKVMLGVHALNIWKIKHVNLLIEDLDGNIVFRRVKDKTIKNEFTIPTQLDTNKAYIIKASITTTSNSTSNFGSIMIKTYSIPKDFKIIRDTIKYTDTGVPYGCKLRTNIDFESYDVDVIDYKHNVTKSYEDVEDIFVNVEDDVNEETIYIRIRGKIDGIKSNWLYLTRISMTHGGFPYNLDANLG